MVVSGFVFTSPDAFFVEYQADNDRPKLKAFRDLRASNNHPAHAGRSPFDHFVILQALLKIQRTAGHSQLIQDPQLLPHLAAA